MIDKRKALRGFEERLNDLRSMDVSAAFHEIVAAASRALTAAAPTEGAGDASAQQDEREALTAYMARFGVEPAGISAQRESDFLAGYRAAAKVQADAAVGTAVAELEVVGTGAIFLHETEHTRNSFVKGKHALYAHPDPLLTECVEALENAVAFIEDAHILEGQWHWEPVEKARAILAKVQAAKGDTQ